MPGLELYGSAASSAPATTVVELPAAPAPALETRSNVYYNPRYDPKHFLEGPLSLNPATRLRQMLARPGIVVCPILCTNINVRRVLLLIERSLLVFATESAHAVLSRRASNASTRGLYILNYNYLYHR